MSHIEKEKLIKADIASIENRVRHAFNQGYDLGFKDGKEKAKPLEQETQTFKWCTDCKEYDQEKHCCHRWSKVIRDTVEEMKQEPRWIPVSEGLPASNQLNSISISKNDLGVDLISRADVLKLMQDNWHTHNGDWAMQESMDDIRALPSVTPQEPKTGHWIENAPEYQNIDPPYICSECGNMHLRKTNYCDQCGAKMIEPQERENE